MDTQAIEIPKQLEAYLPPIESEYDNKDQLASSLDVLAQVVNILEIPDASFFNYSQAITKMSSESMALSRSLDRLKAVEEDWNEVLTPGHPTSLGLIKKAKEYHRDWKLTADQRYLDGGPLIVPVTLAQLMEQKEKNLAKQRELKEKRAKLKTFKVYPPASATNGTNQLRERLLARMADSVS
ncbi:hypothetical protein BJ912DRAFT_983094 [Pholiota molesta]|nr:hypothetical protein BJ912DRAFT_983094 [Pholiota molesta]